jgi:hypothetical protein
VNTWRYRFGGLAFASAIHLPEWTAFADRAECAEPDVAIALDRAPEPLPEPIPPPAIRPRECTFWIRRGGRYRVLDGRRIEVTPAPDMEAPVLRLMLLGSALAALCYQRGILLLHASAVRAGGRTLAFCGPAGSGKSSLAAAFVRLGADFVCDDLGRFIAGAPPAVYPSTPRLKLWRESLASLPWSADTLERDHARRDKFHVPQSHADPWSPLPLDAIYLLDWHEGPAAATPLSGVHALRALVGAATYRPDLLDAMGGLAAHWQRCAALAAGARISRLSRTRTWRAVDDAVAAVAVAAGLDPARRIP